MKMKTEISTRAKELYKTMSAPEVAKKLTEEGFKTVRGGPFTTAGIYNIVLAKPRTVNKQTTASDNQIIDYRRSVTELGKQLYRTLDNKHRAEFLIALISE